MIKPWCLSQDLQSSVFVWINIFGRLLISDRVNGDVFYRPMCIKFPFAQNIEFPNFVKWTVIQYSALNLFVALGLHFRKGEESRCLEVGNYQL